MVNCIWHLPNRPYFSSTSTPLPPHPQHTSSKKELPSGLTCLMIPTTILYKDGYNNTECSNNSHYTCKSRLPCPLDKTNHSCNLQQIHKQRPQHVCVRPVPTVCMCDTKSVSQCMIFWESWGQPVYDLLLIGDLRSASVRPFVMEVIRSASVQPFVYRRHDINQCIAFLGEGGFMR